MGASGPGTAGRKKGEPPMAAAILIIAVGIFAIGAVVGIIAVVSLGIKREDRNPFLQVVGPDNLTRGARFLTGLSVKNDDYVPNVFEDTLAGGQRRSA
jgi:hypothetical protein